MAQKGNLISAVQGNPVASNHGFTRFRYQDKSSQALVIARDELRLSSGRMLWTALPSARIDSHRLTWMVCPASTNSDIVVLYTCVYQCVSVKRSSRIYFGLEGFRQVITHECGSWTGKGRW